MQNAPSRVCTQLPASCRLPAIRPSKRRVTGNYTVVPLPRRRRTGLSAWAPGSRPSTPAILRPRPAGLAGTPVPGLPQRSSPAQSCHAGSHALPGPSAGAHASRPPPTAAKPPCLLRHVLPHHTRPPAAALHDEPLRHPRLRRRGGAALSQAVQPRLPPGSPNPPSRPPSCPTRTRCRRAPVA